MDRNGHLNVFHKAIAATWLSRLMIYYCWMEQGLNSEVLLQWPYGQYSNKQIVSLQDKVGLWNATQLPLLNIWTSFCLGFRVLEIIFNHCLKCRVYKETQIFKYGDEVNGRGSVQIIFYFSLLLNTSLSSCSGVKSYNRLKVSMLIMIVVLFSQLLLICIPDRSHQNSSSTT